MLHGLELNETPLPPVVTTPAEYTDKLERLNFENQQIVMAWMAKNAIHELALTTDGVLPTSDLADRLAEGLHCSPQQLYYGLQWGDEAGYLSFGSRSIVELLPQPKSE